jgi:selenocysteine lyase/cysteine desulfurase
MELIVKSKVNWELIRQDFPAVNKFAYFSAASGSPIPKPVHEKATAYYQEALEYGDYHWRANLAQREKARISVAAMINAEPDEVEFISSTSAGMNLLAGMLAAEGEILSSTLEFPSTTLPWLHARPDCIRWIQPDSTGAIPVERFQNKMDHQTKTILTSHVQYSNGFRQDLVELGGAKQGHHLIVNGTQAVGAFEVDVKAMRIDALCCNSYKWLMSGYGCGFIYVSRRLLEDYRTPFVGWFSVEDRDSHLNNRIEILPNAQRFNLGSPPFPNIFALGAGVEYLQSIGLENIQERALGLNRYLTKRLEEIGVEVLSPLCPEKYRSAQTLVKLAKPVDTVNALTRKGILCTRKPEGMRVATHFFVNEADIDRLIEALVALNAED